ncbi:MAG TPA: CvpA family protein [Rhizomicrobium sp.]|nr:CvpA family protein [Rhizomicrobium sp.]
MNLDFTLVDVLVVVTIILSAIYAGYRGFVSESLSIVAWAAAAFATLYFAPSIVPYVRERMSTPLVGTLAAYGGIFLAVLLPLSFMSHRISQNVQHSPVGTVDRVLGAVFGVARGLAVIGIAYIVFSLFVPIHSHPHWIRDARLLPLVQESSDVLLTLVPDQHLARAESDSGTVPIHHAAVTSAPYRSHKKYGADERRALDHLIETTGNSDGSQ